MVHIKLCNLTRAKSLPKDQSSTITLHNILCTSNITEGTKLGISYCSQGARLVEILDMSDNLFVGDLVADTASYYWTGTSSCGGHCLVLLGRYGPCVVETE